MREGLQDLDAGRDTPAAALLQMATTRLAGVGIVVPAGIDAGPAGHRLYDLLSDEDRRTAHSQYNALTGRIVSYLRAAEHAPRSVEVSTPG